MFTLSYHLNFTTFRVLVSLKTMHLDIINRNPRSKVRKDIYLRKFKISRNIAKSLFISFGVVPTEF